MFVMFDAVKEHIDEVKKEYSLSLNEASYILFEQATEFSQGMIEERNLYDWKHYADGWFDCTILAILAILYERSCDVSVRS